MGVLLVARWVRSGPTVLIDPRVPGRDKVPADAPAVAAAPAARPVPGEPIPGPGRPSAITAAWPWFRGPDRDAISKETVRLARTWPAAGPKRLWTVPLGDGYAAAAVQDGRVYVLDYDVDRSADTLRCLSLDDGREIWRNGYPVESPTTTACRGPFPRWRAIASLPWGPSANSPAGTRPPASPAG